MISQEVHQDWIAWLNKQPAAYKRNYLMGAVAHRLNAHVILDLQHRSKGNEAAHHANDAMVTQYLDMLMEVQKS